jgi:hypothetical protein
VVSFLGRTGREVGSLRVPVRAASSILERNGGS